MKAKLLHTFYPEAVVFTVDGTSALCFKEGDFLTVKDDSLIIARFMIGSSTAAYLQSKYDVDESFSVILDMSKAITYPEEDKSTPYILSGDFAVVSSTRVISTQDCYIEFTMVKI